jgi:Cell wall hydrolyses involved in spore germination
MTSLKRYAQKTVSFIIALAVIFSLIPLSSAPAHAAGNLISNPGGETASGWTKSSGNTTTVYYGSKNYSAQYTRTGSGSFYMYCNSNGNGEISQTVTGLVIGKTYKASVWVNNYLSYSQYPGTAGLSIAGQQASFSTWKGSGFHQLSITFVATSTTTTFKLFGQNINDDVSFDDCSLEEQNTSPFTSQEIEYLASLIFYEARGGNTYCRELVAQVAVNRCNDSRFPNTLYSVLTQSGQYATASLVINNSWRTHPEYNANQASCFAAASKVANGLSVNESGQSWPASVLFHGTYTSAPVPGASLYRTISGENFFTY